MGSPEEPLRLKGGPGVRGVRKVLSGVTMYVRREALEEMERLDSGGHIPYDTRTSAGVRRAHVAGKQ
eukprot:1384838-Amorphochlora_amoeboformis.AAC.1